MRNLKKILALVLALVMSVSVMSVAGAEFKDAADIDKYEDAVEVLAGLGIFTGYKDAEGNYTFNPNGTITRKEVAALIYRIDTADVDNERVAIYSDWNKFEDVPADSWYAGYVNYCANAGWIKGRSDTTFDPNGEVTGYEVLAMILRVIGYDKEGEYSGSMWREHVFADATKLHITDGMNSKDTLGASASRQLVAELLFRAIKDVPQVKYTLLTGYVSTNDIFGMGEENETVGYSRFGLLKKYDANKNDDWGRPYGAWEYVTGKTDAAGNLVQYDIPGTETYQTALAVKTVAMDHCCVYDLVKKTKINVWDNGIETKNVVVNPYSTTQLFGGQGVTLEIYKDRLVIIDTYLAEVKTAVKESTDKAGHVKVWAHNDIEIYTDKALIMVEEEDGTLTVTNTDTVFSGEKLPVYETGKFLLVTFNEKTGMMDITGEPQEITAKQTFIWRNSNFHTIDGEKYVDHDNYELDKAEADKTTAYRWFFDGEMNVIGSTTVPAEVMNGQYVVVLGIYWKVIDFENAYAYARVQELAEGSEPRYVKIKSVDGQPMMYAGTAPALDPITGKVDVESFRTSGRTFHEGFVYTTYQYNLFTTEHMYKIAKGNFETGLELDTVGNHMDTAILLNKYSEVVAGDKTKSFFTDNETVYYILEKGSLKTIKGYANLDADRYDCANVDYITHDTTGKDLFVDLIYIETAVEYEEKAPAATLAEKYDFVYFTNNTHHYKLGSEFVLTGVVNAAGATELHFAENHFGDAETTWETLVAMQELYRNHLCLVKTVGGKVVSVEVVNEATAATIAKATTVAQFIEDGSYIFDNKGVLLINDKKLPLNCNELTLVINDEGKAEYLPVDVLAETLEGANFFVVYNAYRMISAIYVTDIKAPIADDKFALEMNTYAVQMLNAMNNKSLATIGHAFTYEVAKDATVDEINTDLTAVQDALVEWFVANSNVGVAMELYGIENFTVYAIANGVDAKLQTKVVFTFKLGEISKTFEVNVTLTRAAK